MGSGTHRGARYSAEQARPAAWRRWGARVWHIVHPPLPAPLTSSLSSPTDLRATTDRRAYTDIRAAPEVRYSMDLHSPADISRSSLPHLRPEDVRRVRFSVARYREGYDLGQVDEFLDRVEQQLRADGRALPFRPLIAEDVINQRFSATRFRAGYDQDEVDDFLDRIVTELRRPR